MYEPYENQEQSSQWESYYHVTPPQKSMKEKKGITGGKIVAIALICSLLGGLLGAGGMFLGNKLLNIGSSSNQTSNSNISNILVGNRENAVIDTNAIDTGKLLTQAEVYAANVNSTVGITTSITTNYWGYQSTSAASGSGFVFSDNGYILTNFHVVEDSDSITVTMYDGTSYDAALIGYDESNDVAVLKIEATNLTPVVLGDSDKVNIGDNVIAIGNPLGELTFSLTSGSISAKDRDITMSSGSTMQLMQTDCAINSGNSGGALFNMYGEVIGITNAKYSSSSSGTSIDNIGFAIPINKARTIAESIIKKGYFSKPYVGISVTTVSTETQSYGLPQGAAIKSIENDSPAAKAGLKVNDIITHIDGNTIESSSDVVNIVNRSEIGGTIKFTIYRQGSTIDITITVGEQIQSATEKENAQNQNQNQRPPFPWG